MSTFFRFSSLAVAALALSAGAAFAQSPTGAQQDKARDDVAGPLQAGPFKGRNPLQGAGPLQGGGPLQGSGPLAGAGPQQGSGPLLFGTGPIMAGSPLQGSGPLLGESPLLGTGPLQGAGPLLAGGPLQGAGPLLGAGPLQGSAPVLAGAVVATPVISFNIPSGEGALAAALGSLLPEALSAKPGTPTGDNPATTAAAGEARVLLSNQSNGGSTGSGPTSAPTQTLSYTDPTPTYTPTFIPPAQSPPTPVNPYVPVVSNPQPSQNASGS